MQKRVSIGTSTITCKRIITSLEIELPFVYHLFGTKAKVVMIMVGNVSEKQKKEYAKYGSPLQRDDDM